MKGAKLTASESLYRLAPASVGAFLCRRIDVGQCGALRWLCEAKNRFALSDDPTSPALKCSPIHWRGAFSLPGSGREWHNGAMLLDKYLAVLDPLGAQAAERAPLAAAAGA